MKTIRTTLGALLAGATLLVTGAVIADSAPKNVLNGRSKVYENLDPISLEDPTSAEGIREVGNGNLAPTEIWARLEHGEKVECLDCIPVVSKLIYNSDQRTREISTWWLRRRILGVFGPGQIYQQTLQTVTDGAASETKRAYAVEALGEFLAAPGIPVIATALTSDPSPKVRKSAAYALWRINSQGPNGELAAAIADKDEDVRMEALFASTRVNVFTGVDAVVKRISDESPRVRKRSAEALGTLRAKDAVAGLIALTSPATEPDAGVRAAAVSSLGKIADAAAKDAVKAAQSDPNQFVRDAAAIALRRL
ncbi:MAG: HEAT repeat domain-containing protein [Polyangiaceae bacterium]|nr:HEAT repeat domain-containing protein [Polyangiaceae bacterium]MBK9001300.1 HEAT repeat domain-containing protein [Myxococcales bacterium]MCE7888291.1 HEAT repeat domain-containing protein [Sorangiineae bacterium PRO1]MCL4752178.1 HEAT repeat domain-containing protein [Myxococcales bacterium]